MEFGSIERQIHVDASPDIVFDVVSKAEHLRQWWPDEAVIEAPGVEGRITFNGATPDENQVESFTVLTSERPSRFVFRWAFESGLSPAPENSLLVTFELQPAGDGTLVTMTESGFRERGWEAAQLEAIYRDHISGWDYFVPRLAAYVARLSTARS